MTDYPRLAADPGRIVPNPDIPAGELKIALFDAPENSFSEPTVLLAASTSGAGWKRQYVEISHGGRVQLVRTAPCKATLGHAATALGAADTDGSVEVVLHDSDQWLVSCSDADLAQGDNRAVLGNEVIQFAVVTPLEAGRFRLARLLRGRHESAIAKHSKGELFVLIERDAFQPITLPVWIPGAAVHASATNGAAHCSLIPVCAGRPLHAAGSKP